MAQNYTLKQSDNQVYVITGENLTVAIAPDWYHAKRIKRGLEIVDELARQRAARLAIRRRPLSLPHTRKPAGR